MLEALTEKQSVRFSLLDNLNKETLQYSTGRIGTETTENSYIT